jgi:hypothetical protein
MSHLHPKAPLLSVVLPPALETRSGNPLFRLWWGRAEAIEANVDCPPIQLLQLFFKYPPHVGGVAHSAKIHEQLMPIHWQSIQITFHSGFFAVRADCCLQPTAGRAVEKLEMHNGNSRGSESLI